MNGLTASVGLRKDNQAPHPRIFRRTFACGHPDEFIEARRDNDEQLVHNLITFEVFQQHSRTRSNGLEYTMARCLNCARKVKDDDDRDQWVLPARNLRDYQALEFPRFASGSYTPRNNGFDSVLERYRSRSGKRISAKFHPRVSEQQHQEFRRQVEAQARSGSVLVAMPSRRICNAPVQNDLQTLLRYYVSYASEDEDMSLFRPQIGTALECNSHRQVDNSLSDTVSNNQKDKTSFSVAVQQKGNEDEYIKDTINGGAELAYFNATPTSASIDENSAMSVKRVSLLNSGSPVLSKLPTMEDLTTKNEDSPLSTRTTSAVSRNKEATPSHFITDSTPPGRESLLVEHLIDQYASSFTSAANPPLLDLMTTHPQPASPTPNKRPINFLHRRPNISTKPRSKSDSLSRNIRKMRLDLQHSTRAARRVEADGKSPDWACRTSRAVEAGRISMESVGIHMSRPIRGPTITTSAERRVRQGVRVKEPRSAYSSSARCSSECSSAPDRHSDGARHGPADRLGGLEGLEITLRTPAPARHNSSHAASSVDVHKSLPALPLSRDAEGEGDNEGSG